MRGRAEETPPDQKFEDYTDLWGRGEYQIALKQLEEQIEKARRIPLRWMLDRAELRFIMGNVDGAISDQELVTTQIPEPAYYFRLAQFYKYRGKLDEYKETLTRASEQAQRFSKWGMTPQNKLAAAQIAEALGENPKTILTSYYAGLHEEYPDFAAGFVGAGDLAFRKADYKLAAEYYEKAIKADANDLEAMAGLAECYAASGDDRAEGILKSIAKIDPHYPRMRAIEVQGYLDMGQPDEAMKIIEKMLIINSDDLRFLGFQAAALFLTGNLKKMEEVQKDALDFNPHDPTAFLTTAKVASRHYRFKEAVEFSRKALEVDSSDNDAQIQLGFDLLRLGEEKEGRKILEKSFQTEKYNVQLYNMLTLLDTLDTYQTIERGPFILKLPKKEAPIIAEDALSLLTEAYERYRKKYDVELETPIMVQIFNRHDDFMVRSIGLPGSLGYMGICFGRLVTMDSPSARSKGSMNWRAVLWHEFVHVITLQKTKNKMPRWLSEGISVYEESQFSPAWKQLMELDYKPMVSQGDLPGLSDLEPYFTTPKSPQHLVFGYFLAGEFVHFYVERYGFEALKGALARMGEGQECNVALAEACGRPLSDIDAAFKGYLRERLKPYENLPAIHVAADDAATSAMATAPAHVSDDSPYTDAIHKAEAAVAAKKWDEAEAEFKKAHEMFPDRVGPGSPLDGLVLLYESTSRREAVEQALRQQIDTDQHALPACQKLLAMLVEDQNWAEVARLADWSLGIDPFDVTIREAMLKAVRKSGDRERELTLLAQLVELDPSHTLDYRLDTIETLIALERWDPAKKMTLALLEETPHFWRAQELLLKIVEHKGGAPTYAVP